MPREKSPTLLMEPPDKAARQKEAGWRGHHISADTVGQLGIARHLPSWLASTSVCMVWQSRRAAQGRVLRPLIAEPPTVNVSHQAVVRQGGGERIHIDAWDAHVDAHSRQHNEADEDGQLIGQLALHELLPAEWLLR